MLKNIHNFTTNNICEIQRQFNF